MINNDQSYLNALRNSRYQFAKLLAGIFFISFITACQNDLKKINSLPDFANQPVESAKDISILRSDSGKLQLYMTSPQLDRYQGEQSYTKYPKGIHIVFYDEKMKEKMKLSANYAVNFEAKGIMEMKNNVVIIDIKKGDTIYTESLVRDQKKNTISSNVFVKRVNKDGVLYGEGFDADESFNNYNLRRPRGSINLDKTE